MAGQSRVTRACVRCRKQKLKCDALRPCTLCQRSGVHCEPRDISPTVPKPPRKRRRQTLPVAASPSPPEVEQQQPQRRQSEQQSTQQPPQKQQYDRVSVQATSPDGVLLPSPHSPVEVGAFRSPAVSSQISHGTGTSATAERQHFGANSSAVGFAAHLFGDSAASYSSSDIASIPGHAGRPARVRGAATVVPAVGAVAAAGAAHHDYASAATSAPWWSLVTMPAPPSLMVVEALLDAYFDRMHWHINIFHEPTVRRTARRVLSNGNNNSPSHRWPRSELGAVLTTLTVAALGLQCVASDASWPGHALLAASETGPGEAGALRDALIQEVRVHLLDLLDDCCIETVQVCSLLGTYYMFHASPTLAWSILGMSVRTAYALALHCDTSSSSSTSGGDADADDSSNSGSQKTTDTEFDPVLAQVRRRNWNHITVSDTFSAMIYGRPASLDAAFSHVQPLQDLDDTALGPGLASHPLLASSSSSSSASHSTSTLADPPPTPPPPVTQLTFHVLKFRLYGIIRQALNRFRLLRLQNPISPEDLASLVQAVQHARAQLDAWRADLPPLFAIDDESTAAAALVDKEEALPSQLAELAKIPGLSPDEEAARHRLSLQVMTLHATYDNTVIFVHRPLLEYRVPARVPRSLHIDPVNAAVAAAAPQGALDVVAQSLDLSVQAALRMSRMRVQLLENQFVVSFELMNLFTAGVILCIPPTTWPLSAIAHQAKAGTMRIIRASRRLQHVSRIAVHTEKLLTRLLKLSLQQELDNGLQQELGGGEFISEDGGERFNQDRNQSHHDQQQQQHQQHHHHQPQQQQQSPSCGVNHNILPELVRRYPHQQQQETALHGHAVPAVSASLEQQQVAITTGTPFSLDHDTNVGTGGGGAHLGLISPATGGSIYSDPAQLSTTAGGDFRRPPAMGYYYADQRQQVDSQLDEAFGTFGQILFNLVPDDPYSAWNWGNGGL